MDHIFTMRQILEKTKMKEKEVHLIFIDLQKAFDIVPQKLLYKALEKAGIDKSLINVIRLIYKDNKSKMEMENELS